VTTTPDGIACGPACSGAAQPYPAGAVVTLHATPAGDWVFVGWSGEPDCADGVVTLTDAKTCVATFAATMPLFAKQAPRNGGAAGRVVELAAYPASAYEPRGGTIRLNQQ
jgi:hypothetical protein